GDPRWRRLRGLGTEPRRTPREPAAKSVALSAEPRAVPRELASEPARAIGMAAMTGMETPVAVTLARPPSGPRPPPSSGPLSAIREAVAGENVLGFVVIDVIVEIIGIEDPGKRHRFFGIDLLDKAGLGHRSREGIDRLAAHILAILRAKGVPQILAGPLAVEPLKQEEFLLAQPQRLASLYVLDEDRGDPAVLAALARYAQITGEPEPRSVPVRSTLRTSP